MRKPTAYIVSRAMSSDTLEWFKPEKGKCLEYVPLYKEEPPRPAVRLSAVDMLALKPDNEAIIDDQWLVRFAINIELDVLERNGL